jgi:LacI family transcriptional regulator
MAGPQGKNEQGRVTLKAIATLSGVHVSTVSRALNIGTRSMVVPSVAERVIKVADRLGYRPDNTAISLRTGESKLIGIILPDIANAVFAPILSGASQRFSALGYSVIVADVGNDAAQQLDFVSRLAARRVDGLILATVSRKDSLVSFCVDRQIPSVLVNRAEIGSRLSAVTSDDALGMQIAVDHLVSLGHKRIGHLGGPMNLSTGFLRRQGFVKAMASRGLNKTDLIIANASAYSRAAGATAARVLLDAHPKLTAIAAANDLLALGAYDVMQERNLFCPADISIVGHNDMMLMDMVNPALTTIRISHKEMGRQSADLLVEIIGNSKKPVCKIVLPPELIVRNSTGIPRSLAPAS